MAKRIIRNQNYRKLKQEQKRLMRITISDIAKQLEAQKWMFQRTTREVMNTLSKEAFNSYKHIKQETMVDTWNREKKEKDDKLEWWVKKAREESGAQEIHNIEGIRITHDELIELFGDGGDAINPAIYGGVE